MVLIQKLKHLLARMKPVWAAIYDVLAAPLILLGAVNLKMSRRFIQDYGKMPVNKFIFERIGVFPVQNHYYEPLIIFNQHTLERTLCSERKLPGIDLNVDGQLSLLASCNYSAELSDVPERKKAGADFYYRNGMFGHGDADCLYNMVRHFKPRRLIEIGSGFSTLMAHKALLKNLSEEPGCTCEHICIEPYEAKWLDRPGIQIYRKRVEKMDRAVFDSLGENDILFIDSSHIIRPQGDVLLAYQEILPLLRPGVIVHIHDIFTPFDYPREWVVNKRLFWNEQYLVEAFLTMNRQYEILIALHYLWKEHLNAFVSKFPNVTEENALPCSLWIRKL